MSVPSFQQLMLPALQTIGQRYDEISIAGLEDEVVKTLRISPEERTSMLPSGNQTVFANRLNWARSYLSKAGLIELPRRGYCRATDRGRELLAEGVNEIDLGLLERYPEFVAWRGPEQGGARSMEEPRAQESPGGIDRLQFRAPQFRAGATDRRAGAFLQSGVLRAPDRRPPGADGLRRRPHGDGPRARPGRRRRRRRRHQGGRTRPRRRLRPSQAARSRERRSAVAKCAISSAGWKGHRATKGVLVTTSYFPSTAYDFITRVSKRVVLIDGQELANLMIRHRVGVRVKDVYEVRKIDENYFVE